MSRLMPGVLIIEALAQTGAVAILSVEENRGKRIFCGNQFCKIQTESSAGRCVDIGNRDHKAKRPDRCRPCHSEGGG